MAAGTSVTRRIVRGAEMIATLRVTCMRSRSVPETLRLSKVVRINANAGWLWDRIADHHFLICGAGIDWHTPDDMWTLTAEIFGQLGTAILGIQPR